MSGVLSGLIGAFAPVASSYESIATVTAAVATGTLSFSSIPGTYKSLQIRGIARMTDASAGGNPINIRFNSDAAANYSYHKLAGNGSTVSASGAASQTWGETSYAANYTNNVDMWGVSIIDIIDYASTTKNKTVKAFSGIDLNNNITSIGLGLSSSLWLSTSAITKIDLLSTMWGTAFAAGTTFALYGIKG